MKIDFENSTRLYYSIKEVAAHFGVKESSLRFWESEFKEIKPRKTAGGTRQYTKEDIDIITVIFHLVKEKGMTLDGARQILRNKKDEETRRQEILRKLEGIRKDLNDFKAAFDALDTDD
ncbi:DNA-binding transcriptional MerR regulator [Dysgonomonas sp. PH5-45]|uniref:MerR family transcriptional regulator n=1 Tax=unclassified Dysgonomonas TaxID=2630389 RepID=UPI0024767E08|nr:MULTISPECIES: MerR family transcriptional regulator [unclassified Dysgonomonas]MDH6355963.1 DNA-binding transcriptional MerR regulator [Dysgonomonas sp. PH5-45]MDH6388858.1 DNA-binding transcriptional MerR regulator [Dysgonomonas sp. PH5-37]